MDDFTPGDGRLRVVRCVHGEVLADALASELLAAPADPFATEVVAVPTPGVERWLAQSLATRLGTGGAGADDGICAGVWFPTLDALLADVSAQVSGVDRRADPWSAQNLTWTVLATILDEWDEPWLGAVTSHLGSPAEEALRPGRRWSTARRLAGLFASYADQRPAVLAAWQSGADTDGAGGPVPPDLTWQPALWRAVRDRVVTAHPGIDDPVRRARRVREQLEADPSVVTLPARLAVFGPTRLSVHQRDLLGSLARHRDVSLWLTHPSPRLWQRLAERPARVTRRSDDADADVPQNRLTARLGRDMRELQSVLGEVSTTLLPAPEPGDTLLHRLQRAVANDAVAGEDRRLVAVDDNSVQVHSSHGLDRQVEVLRDVLAGLLADDPTLEPRDIVVMCPDIERVAPLVAARFALDPEREPTHPAQRFRVRLADRSLDQINPLLGLLRRLLDLSIGRNGVTDLLDLCAAPAVRRRFRFSEDDLARLGELAHRSGMRWGIDRDDRARFGMQAFAQNTWRAGLDRLLTGVALSEDDLPVLGLALPLDEVDSGDVDLVGRLTELVHRLRLCLAAFDDPQPLSGWAQGLRGALDLLTAVPPDDNWQYGHAWSVLADLAETADGDGPAVTPGDLRALFDATLTGRPSRSNFRTGTLTMCTLSPMRSVPHRIVCLLGLDDGVFPRALATDGDDLLARDPRTGERDPRSEDRQLLLDAVMAAREKLIVIHSGADPRTNEPRPPSVPLQELIDAIDDLSLPGPTRTALVTAHRLQPFAAANFAIRGAGPFSFDTAALAGARATLAARVTPAADQPLPAWQPVPVPDEIGLDDLARFLKNPAKYFLRTRLGLTDTDHGEDDLDTIPVDVGSLERWQIGNRMLTLALAGHGRAEIERAEWLRGSVPPQQLGSRLLDDISSDLAEIWRRAGDQILRPPGVQDVDVTVEVPAAYLPRATAALRVRVSGVVTDIRDDIATTISYSRPSATTRLQAWLSLTALTASAPGTPWRHRTVGRRGALELGPIAPDLARTGLTRLVGLALRGLSEPVFLPARTAVRFAEIRHQGGDWQNWRERRYLRKQWEFDHDPAWGRFVAGDLHDLMDIAAPASLAELTRQTSWLAAAAELAIVPMLSGEAT